MVVCEAVELVDVMSVPNLTGVISGCGCGWVLADKEWT